jgi:flagellar protein FliJ
MKQFAFQFASLQKLRHNQRDLCRQLLAEVLRRDEELVERRRRAEAERAAQLEELQRSEAGPAVVNVDGSVSRRVYAGQLIGDIARIEHERALLSQQIELCRQALLRADQSLKTLDKLADRRRAEFVYEEERREARDLEENWRAMQLSQN